MAAAGASVVVTFASDRPGAERVADIKASVDSAPAIQANVSVVAEVHRPEVDVRDEPTPGSVPQRGSRPLRAAVTLVDQTVLRLDVAGGRFAPVRRSTGAGLR